MGSTWDSGSTHWLSRDGHHRRILGDARQLPDSIKQHTRLDVHGLPCSSPGVPVYVTTAVRRWRVADWARSRPVAPGRSGPRALSPARSTSSSCETRGGAPIWLADEPAELSSTRFEGTQLDPLMVAFAYSLSRHQP